MPLMKKLLALHMVDSQVRGLRSRVENAQIHLRAQERQHSEAEHRYEELQTRKRHIQAKIANLESEGDRLDGQLEKYREDLNSASTNKQYSAVLSELNTVKEARAKLDDQMLSEMEATESLDAELEEANHALEERRKLRDHAQKQLEERQREIGERLAELEEERDRAAADVPDRALSVFDEMAEMTDGEPMAPVSVIDKRRREYACGACSIHMPFEQVMVLMGDPSEIVQCTNCHRILYIQPENADAMAAK